MFLFYITPHFLLLTNKNLTTILVIFLQFFNKTSMKEELNLDVSVTYVIFLDFNKSWSPFFFKKTKEKK